MQLSAFPRILLSPILVLAAAPALAQEDDAPVIDDPLSLEDPRPFAQGDKEVSISLGLGSSGGETQYSVGGAFAYYVLPGLAPGADVTVQGGTHLPTELWALAPLKWVLYRSYDFAPYVVVAGGRIFIGDGVPDVWLVGAGPGFHLFSSKSVGLQAQLLFYRLLPSSRCEGFADGCDGLLLRLGLGIVL